MPCTYQTVGPVDQRIGFGQIGGEAIGRAHEFGFVGFGEGRRRLLRRAVPDHGVSVSPGFSSTFSCIDIMPQGSSSGKD
jgi:hypothetical protein